MISLTPTALAQVRLCFALGAFVVMFLGASQGAQAQGLVQGVQQGAEAGNKAAGPTRGAGAIPVLADRVPAAVHRVTAPLARHGASLLFDTMVTNVPIPSRQLSLAGAPLKEVYPIVPLAHGQALGIALSAYRGRVHIGLHADRRAMPDLHRLADAVPVALSALAVP